MLISHEHKFIFIKTQKTAGTSIEISLSRYLDHPNDVITPINPEDEVLRTETGRKPMNFLEPDAGNGPEPKKRFWNHIGAAEVRAKVSDEIWRTYYKFCFERNPWDKVVSMYWFMKGKKTIDPDMDFATFVSQIAARSSDWSRYTDDDLQIVDLVGQYKDVGAILDTVCKRVGIGAFDGWLPKAKSGFRMDRSRYTASYDARTRDMVGESFAKEIAMFGYRFE